MSSTLFGGAAGAAWATALVRVAAYMLDPGTGSCALDGAAAEPMPLLSSHANASVGWRCNFLVADELDGTSGRVRVISN